MFLLGCVQLFFSYVMNKKIYMYNVFLTFSSVKRSIKNLMQLLPFFFIMYKTYVNAICNLTCWISYIMRFVFKSSLFTWCKLFKFVNTCINVFYFKILILSCKEFVKLKIMSTSFFLQYNVFVRSSWKSHLLQKGW